MTADWIPLLVPSDRYTEYAALVLADATEFGLLQSDGGRALAQSVASGVRDFHGSARDQPPTNELTERERAAEQLAQQPPYSEHDLAKIAQGKSLTTERWTLAMDFCASHPGEFFTTSTICRETGLTINEWRDAPRKLPQHLKRHYPDVPRHTSGEHAGTQAWPLLAWMFRGDGEVSWAMNDEQAQRWRRVRGND